MPLKRIQKKQYIQLESQLHTKYRNLRENELILTESDFIGGHLTNEAFIDLTGECWYIPYEDTVTIKVPAHLLGNLRDDLGFYSSRALHKIKKDRADIIKLSALLVFSGICILTFLTLIYNIAHDNIFVIEFVSILSWVFVWSGTQAYFIEQRPILDKRFTILQLLSADIVMY